MQKIYSPQNVSLSSFWSTFIAMARKELLIMARYPVNFIASFGQVFLTVAVFTLAGRIFYVPPAAQSGLSNGSNPAGIVVYGFILYLFLNDTLWSVGYNVRTEQVRGTLEQLYLSPASKFASLVARVINTLVWTGLLCIAGGALMTVLIGRLPVENPLLGLYLFILTLIGTFGVGFAFAALTLQIKETAQTLANLLQFAFLVLCANFFPFAALPPFILKLSHLIPLAYAVDAFRSALMGFPEGFPELAPFPVEFWIVTIFGITMPILGYYLYRAAERKARKDGSLSNY
jgi:ABC-type polysaccharide/polyol phosphate export permease